jgi:hypothetical protein
MKKLRYILVFCFLIAAGTIVMTGCEKKPSGAGKISAGTYT